MDEKIRAYRSRIKQDTRGAAMVIVMCVLAVFLALSSSLLLSASVAVNTARNNVTLERCKIQAVTLSDLFVRELENGSSGLSDNTVAAKDYHLVEYVQREIMGGWPARTEEPDNSSTAVRRFTMDTATELYQMEIAMYWTSQDGNKPSYTEAADTVQLNDTRLFLSIKSTMNNGNFQVDTELKLNQIMPDKTETENEEKIRAGSWMWETVGRASSTEKGSEMP